MLINIRNLKVQAVIGVHDWERTILQEVRLNLAITVENESSCKSDNLNDTVDYDGLASEITSAVEASQYYLVERLGGEIRAILKKYPLIAKADIEIIKPGAIKNAEYISIILEYWRNNDE